MCDRSHLSIDFQRLVQRPLAEQVQVWMLRTFAVQVELYRLEAVVLSPWVPLNHRSFFARREDLQQQRGREQRR